MYNSKLITILKTLSPDELKAFHKFIQSPYFNTNPTVLRLYEYIRQYAPLFTHKKLRREVVFAHLFDGETYREIKLLQQTSALVKLVEEFWLHESLREQAGKETLRLAIAYQKHQLPDYGDTVLQTPLKLGLARQLEQQYEYELKLRLLQHEWVESQQKREQEPLLQPVFDSLDAYFVLVKLKYACKALSFRRFRSIDYEVSMLNDVIQYAATPKMQTIPAIKIYRHAYYTLAEPNEEAHYEDLTAALKQHYAAFERSDTEEMFVYAHNYCIKRLNVNQKAYARKLFQLYQFEIEHAIIHPSNAVSPATIKNILTLAQLCLELEWAAQFLQQFKPAMNDFVYSYNLSRVRFEQGKLKIAAELLEQTDMEQTDALQMLSAKALLLKIYTELSMQPIIGDYDDRAQSLIIAFDAQLHRRRSELTNHYIYYLNFIKYTREWLKLSLLPTTTTKQLEELYQRIDQTVEVAEKGWILKIVRENAAK